MNLESEDISIEQRRKVLFDEIKDIYEDLSLKSEKTSKYAKILWWLNMSFKIIIALSGGSVTTISSVNTLSNIFNIVLGGIIFVITVSSGVLKLEDRGLKYSQGHLHLKKILQQIHDILYNFHKFSTEEILRFLDDVKSQADENSFEMYRSLTLPDKIPEQKTDKIEEKANSSPLLFTDGSSSPERIREKRESQGELKTNFESPVLSEPYFENNRLFIDPKDNHGILNKDERNLEDIDMRRNSMPSFKSSVLTEPSSKNLSPKSLNKREENRRYSSPLL